MLQRKPTIAAGENDRRSAGRDGPLYLLKVFTCYISRMSFVVIVIMLFLTDLYSTSAGQSSGKCISPGGRFYPFSTVGKPPRKVTKGPGDLQLCRVFRQSTCCDAVQTYRAVELIHRLASFGEASRECLQIWELLECSICDPRIGVQPGPPLICSSFCDLILQDCSKAYFSIDSRVKSLSPCGPGDIICGRMREWASNGTELCLLAGFSVKHDMVRNQNTDEQYCFGGKESLESVSSSWKASSSSLHEGGNKIVEDFWRWLKRKPDRSDRVFEDFWQLFKRKPGRSYRVFEDFRRWFKRKPAHEKVRWFVGGMVLTSGIIYASKRKRYSQRQKQAVILRMSRKIGARTNHQSSSMKR